MLRGFRGTVFYNRCRQPPHVRTILSLAFTRYPSYTYVYTAYEQRLFPFLVVGGGGGKNVGSSCLTAPIPHRRLPRFPYFT